MIRGPSDYRADLNLSYQQIWELRKAVTDRIVKLVSRGEEGADGMRWLLETVDILDEHVDCAVRKWESDVVDSETTDLDEKLLDFMNREKTD